MTIAHDTYFLICFVVLAYDRLPGTVLIEFLHCLLVSFAVIALDGRMLCEILFSALDCDLVFVISPRLR